MPDCLYRRDTLPSGRVRYRPVADTREFDGLDPGDYLVTVAGHGRQIRRLDTDGVRAEVLAAMEQARPAMLAAMSATNQYQPRTREASPREVRAAAAYRQVMGSDATIVFDGCSMADVIDAGIAALRDSLAGADDE